MFAPGRKTILGCAIAASLVLAVTPAQAAPSGGCVIGATTTCTFVYTGAAEAWVVPAAVTSAVFDLYGAAGGSFAPFGAFAGGAGGKGGHVRATLALTPGETLNMRVGGAGQNGATFVFSTFATATIAGGFNGGGTNTYGCSGCGFQLGGGGGGSSDVRSGGDALADRLLVAGGGGGGGVGGAFTGDPGTGGDSASAAKSATGYLEVTPAGKVYLTCTGGGAGTLLGPGAAGSGPAGCIPGSAGDPDGLAGGDGTSNELGAGGGGYYGGGAGAGSLTAGAGGGGGSDYPDPANPPSGASNVRIADGVRSGNGLITVTYFRGCRGHPCFRLARP
jgi:hypothetical protein